MLAAVVALLACAAPASAQVSGGDSPAGNTGILSPTGNPAVSGTEQVGQTLTGSDNLSGADTVARGWLRCNNANGTACSLIAGQTSNTYTLVNADADKVIKFRVRGTNLTGSREADAVTGVIDAISPANTVPPSFTGTLRDGQTQTSSPGTWTGTPTIGFSYQWQRCSSDSAASCSDIGGAGSATYRLVSSDLGRWIRVRVIGTRTTNSSDTAAAFSGLRGPVAALTTANVTPPTVQGTARAGETLTATRGTWNGTAPLTYAYFWDRCSSTCSRVATTSSYTLTSADVGRQLRLTVNASGPGGTASAFALSETVVAKSSSAGSGAGGSTLRKLSPFPVIAIGGRILGGRVIVSQLRVRRAPRGAIVTVTCRGRDCPYKRARRRIKRRSGLRIRGLERSLRSGTVIVIIVRKGNTIGKYTRLRIRRRTTPARLDRCIRPGARRPSACPG